MEDLETWFESRNWPSPVGLSMGLGMVLVFQVIVIFYYMICRKTHNAFGYPRTIQFVAPMQKTLTEELWGHVSAPESFLMVFGYLTGVWMLGLLPSSYYDRTQPIKWLQVLLQFLVVDFWTYVSHRLEHYSPTYYQMSHKNHHVFINPKLYNAFNGSPLDTASLILIPLFITAQMCRSVSNWDFIAFGTLYATQFTLIHCEFEHPWEFLLEKVGIGTAADHNVHHAVFTSNYGHFFIYWDLLFGTYKHASNIPRMRTSKSQNSH